LKETGRWFSHNVQQETQLVRWGTYGTPVLLFPTAGGDAEEIERFLMIRALTPLLETDRFREFCATHLAHLDEVALEFFGTDRAREAVRKKVEAMFPEHEHEEFTEHFWGLIQFWRKTESQRSGQSTEADSGSSS